jgi:hypothetical protein
MYTSDPNCIRQLKLGYRSGAGYRGNDGWVQVFRVFVLLTSSWWVTASWEGAVCSPGRERLSAGLRGGLPLYIFVFWLLLWFNLQFDLSNSRR